MKISSNITYAEAIHSETAKRKGIDNTPNPTQIEAMKLLAEKVFQPLREWVGGPIKVNLNKIIGSLNQQVVFNRKKNPSYAAKMKTTMNIVRKRLGKDEDKS